MAVVSNISESAAQQGATERNNQKNEPRAPGSKSPEDKGLQERQWNAIVLLLRGLSDADVAQHVGVDRGTVFRWQNETEFARELSRQREMIMERARKRVQGMLDPALDIIQRQLAGDDPKTALRAAALLLRIAAPPKLPESQRASAPTRSSADSRNFKRAMAYIDAPMPTDPNYKAYMEQVNAEYGDDVDDDEDEFDDDEDA